MKPLTENQVELLRAYDVVYKLSKNRYEQTARRLGISSKVVDANLLYLRRKFGVTRTKDLIKICKERKLI